MKILYVSHLGTDMAAGLCWSVPAGVDAQQRYDDCLWVNTRPSELDHWKGVKAFHRLDEFGKKLSLDILPEFFRRPDVVVFEGFYHPEALVFSWELRKKKVPYIIIPRGSLTRQAFHNHNFLNFLKKKVAVALVLKRFTRRALALQFLTKKEYQDSGSSWNKNHFIIPNGISIPFVSKTAFSQEGIKGVYVGRPSLLHKGLDILINACAEMQSEMRASGFVIDCHMPVKNDYDEVVGAIQENGLSDILVVKPAVYGAEKEKVLLDGDVFIMTSRFEGHPMGLIEAMSYGLPVAVTSGTNMAEEVKEADAGWTSDGSVSDVCRMLRVIVSQRNSLIRKGANARALSNRYEWDALAFQLHERLHSLLE